MIIKRYPANGFGEWPQLELNRFRPDRQDGTGFDMDLLSIDMVTTQNGQVTYASREWSIRAHWLTQFLQKIFGVN